MTYPVLKRHQIFVDIDRRHIAYWKSRENGISKVSPPSQRAAIHIYVSEVQSRQGAISHLRLLHGPKWLRVLALPIGVDRCCLLVVLGSRKNRFRARRPARSRSPSSEKIFSGPKYDEKARRAVWAIFRRPCHRTHWQILSQRMW